MQITIKERQQASKHSRLLRLFSIGSFSTSKQKKLRFFHPRAKKNSAFSTREQKKLHFFFNLIDQLIFTDFYARGLKSFFTPNVKRALLANIIFKKQRLHQHALEKKRIHFKENYTKKIFNL